jgi:hypothetical protein
LPHIEIDNSQEFEIILKFKIDVEIGKHSLRDDFSDICSDTGGEAEILFGWSREAFAARGRLSSCVAKASERSNLASEQRNT